MWLIVSTQKPIQFQTKQCQSNWRRFPDAAQCRMSAEYLFSLFSACSRSSRGPDPSFNPPILLSVTLNNTQPTPSTDHRKGCVYVWQKKKKHNVSRWEKILNMFLTRYYTAPHHLQTPYKSIERRFRGQQFNECKDQKLFQDMQFKRFNPFNSFI